MGFLRKTVKKIGKGIKKLGKKFMKAYGKLGILGQLAFMMFMPQFAGSIMKGLGTYAKAGTSLLHKAAGAIHAGATAVGNAYTTVTDAISNGFDRAGNFVKGEGFVLSPDRASVFGGVPADKFAASTDAVSDKLMNTLDGGPMELTKASVKEAAKDEVAKKSLLEKGKDYVSQAYSEIKADITNPSYAADAATKGVYSGAATKVAYSVAGDPPMQRVLNTNFDVMNMSSYSRSGMINTVDYTANNNAYANAWGAGASIAAPFLSDYVYNGGDNNYAKRVQALRNTG